MAPYLIDDKARHFLLRAAVGLDAPTDEHPPGLPVEWLAPGIKDLLFVSVDIESKADAHTTATGLGYIFHCGISVLDTKILRDYARSISLAPTVTKCQTPPPEVVSYHLSVGNDSAKANQKYLDRRLSFPGHAEHHKTEASAIARIHNILGSRPFVLVTHGGGNDHRFWKTLRLDREPLWTIDTQHIFPFCYPEAFEKQALKDIVSFCRIPFETSQLHIAGYDAHYTLRALLFLAADSANSKKLKKASSPGFNWRAIRAALIMISGNSSISVISAGSSGPREVVKKVLEQLPAKVHRLLPELGKSMETVKAVKPSAGMQVSCPLVRVRAPAAATAVKALKSSAEMMRVDRKLVRVLTRAAAEAVMAVEPSAERQVDQSLVRVRTRSAAKAILGKNKKVHHYSLHMYGKQAVVEEARWKIAAVGSMPSVMGRDLQYAKKAEAVEKVCSNFAAAGSLPSYVGEGLHEKKALVVEKTRSNPAEAQSLPSTMGGDLFTVPGNIRLVPAGPQMPSLNALTTIKPMDPAKRPRSLRRRVSNAQKGVKKALEDTISSLRVVKEERRKKALEDTMSSLRVVKKGRRVRKLRLRAARNSEAANESGAQAGQNLASVSTGGGQESGVKALGNTVSSLPVCRKERRARKLLARAVRASETRTSYGHKRARTWRP